MNQRRGVVWGWREPGLGRRSRPRLHAAVLLLALLVASACGSTKTGFLEEGAPVGRDVGSVLYLPMNFDYTPPPELIDGVERLDAEVRAQLEVAGIELQTVSRSEVAQSWRKAIKAVGGLRGVRRTENNAAQYDLAREELARRILSENDVAAVLMAQLVVVDGRYVGTQLRWDGIRRPPVIERANRGGTAAQIKGKDKATSVRVSVFDRTGHRYFDRQAGIEPLYRYYFNEEFYLQDFGIRKEIRKDLFHDVEALRAGVETAFAPWIVADGATAAKAP